MTDGEWQYSGDVSINYGGTYIRDRGYWFDVVEVIDLASACGADNMVLVETGNTFAGWRNREEIRHALDSEGYEDDMYKLGATTREQSRLRIAYALWSYGHKDIDSSIVLYDADNGSDCANCGEPIAYRKGKCEHFDPDDDGRHDVCGIVKPDTGETAYAEAPRPINWRNGAESWPNDLDDEWRDYADGEPGIRRYLSDKFGITEDDN